MNTAILRQMLQSFLSEHEITQMEISRKSGVNQAVVSLFSSGRRGISFDEGMKLLTFMKNNKNTYIKRGTPIIKKES